MQPKYAFKLKGEDLYLSTSIDGLPCAKESSNIVTTTSLEEARDVVKKSKGLLELITIEYSVTTKQVVYLSDIINAGLELGLKRVLVLQHNVNKDYANSSVFSVYVRTKSRDNLESIYQVITASSETSLAVLPSYKKSVQELSFMYRKLYLTADLVAIQKLDGTFDILKNRYNNIPMYGLV